MQNIIIKQGQSLFDAVIEATGDISNVFTVAVLNNISPTATLAIGDKLLIEGVVNPLVKKSLAGVSPATDFINPAGLIPLDYIYPQTLPIL